MDPLPGILITGREIYEAVVRLTGRVDVLIEQQNAGKAIDNDHEARIRVLERGRWPLPALAAVLGAGGLALSLLQLLL